MDPLPTPQTDSRFSMKVGDSLNGKKILLWAAIALVGFIIYTIISSPMVVTVTGIGEVTVPAESATVSFSVSGNDATPTGAIAVAKAKADVIRGVLVASGIAEADIAESQVRVVPASAVTQGATGFQAVITMGAKTVHVNDTAALISALYGAGASLVAQPVLSVDNKTELENQAFAAALKDAKSNASEVAKRNWKLFRKIIAVEQVTSPSTSTVTSRADVITENQETITGGVFKIVKAVSVSYKMW